MKIREVAIIVVFVFLGFIIRVFIGAYTEFHRAEALLKEGKKEDAIFHYERAIHWYIPLAGFAEASAMRLIKIAEEAEENGDIDNALFVYQVLRSAFYSVRSFYIPGKEWIKICDEKIALLFAKKASDEKKMEEIREEMLKKLKSSKDPDPLWSLISIAGLFGWMGSVFIWYVFGYDTKKRIKFGIISSITFVFSYGLWLLGLLKAH